MKHLNRERISTGVQLILVIFLLGYSAVKGNPGYKENELSRPATQTASSQQLKEVISELWKQHITWNRNVMLCIVDELPGTEQAKKRLYQNTTAIGSAIEPYYGKPAADELTKLIHTHIFLSGEVISFAKEGKETALKQASQHWYANIDSITEFLAVVNPYWKLKDHKLLIKEQLIFTAGQAMHRISKNYYADVIAYDKATADGLKLATIFSDGIAKQFPEKFKLHPKVLIVRY